MGFARYDKSGCQKLIATRQARFVNYFINKQSTESCLAAIKV